MKPHNRRLPQITGVALLLLWAMSIGLMATPLPEDNPHHDIEELYLNIADSLPIYRYFDDTIIAEGEIISGHVVVVKGDLIIRGTIRGDVLVIWGDVEITETGIVEGDVTSVGGQIRLREQAHVTGLILETDHPDATLGAPYLYAERETYPRLYGTLRIPQKGTHLSLQYNRVDGAFLSLVVPRKWWYRRDRHWRGYGFIGYGFSGQFWRYQIGVSRWMLDPLRFRTEIELEFHDLTDTQDEWRIDAGENSLAAFFLKYDWRDYFRRRGFSIALRQNITPYVLLQAGYYRDRYESIARNTNWAVFRGTQDFRPNPQLGEDAGTMGSVLLQVTVDTRDDWERPRRGWFTRVAYERASPELGGVFDFRRYLAETRVYVPTGAGEQLRLRVRAGTAEGHLPWQKSFEIGGISTLRAFPFKAFGGNRMVLANVEYLLSPNIFEDFLGTGGLRFILFADGGDAWQDKENQSFRESLSSFSLNRWKTDVGVGIADQDEDIRINIAKRTDRSANDILVTLRLQRAF
ncbi:MAG: hypothetical protein D6681_08460 [Calditrichaeota bacterium]|nr:MAG: hypothetical protein D6681_08460 [Calditrichota bacterium]